MKDDLIGRKAALELLGEPHPLDYNAVAAVQKIIALPAVDAAPVVHGRWKAAKAGGPNYPFWDSRCSECGYTTSMVIRNWNYCPACGAKMDLEQP